MVQWSVNVEVNPAGQLYVLMRHKWSQSFVLTLRPLVAGCLFVLRTFVESIETTSLG